MSRLHKIPSAILMVSIASGCTYQTDYDPTFVPDEEPVYLSADEVLLLMPAEEEEFVHTGAPSSYTGYATNLTIPLGLILKEVAQEILEDRFSGGTDFANLLSADSGYLVALHPSIERFDYWYNSLRNLGIATTPQVEIALRVEILDGVGDPIFDQVYESGRVSAEDCFACGKLGERISQLVHEVIYDLLEQSFEDAGPTVVGRIDEARESRRP